MTEPLILTPRYRLDDEAWLIGVDPSRQYWLSVNGNAQIKVIIPGLMVSSLEELREIMQEFRSLRAGEKMKIERIVGSSMVHCVGQNCYAIEGRVNGALTWHLFDLETLESLLMTSHPDWIPSPTDIELGRALLFKAFEQPAYAC